MAHRALTWNGMSFDFIDADTVDIMLIYNNLVLVEGKNYTL